MASTDELAHGEKSHTQSLTQSLNHPAYLMRREPKLLLQNSGEQIAQNCCFYESFPKWHPLANHIFRDLFIYFTSPQGR